MLWEELYNTYGFDFLAETNTGDPIYEMADLETVLDGECKKNGTTRVFALGEYSYGYYGGSFDYRQPYFLIDNAGNFASMGDGDILNYLRSEIDEHYFLDWLLENNYVSPTEYKRLQDDI